MNSQMPTQSAALWLAVDGRICQCANKYFEGGYFVCTVEIRMLYWTHVSCNKLIDVTDDRLRPSVSCKQMSRLYCNQSSKPVGYQAGDTKRLRICNMNNYQCSEQNVNLFMRL